jgi:hypothetical protein
MNLRKNATSMSVKFVYQFENNYKKKGEKSLSADR